MCVSADPLLSVLLLPYADSNSRPALYTYAHIYFIYICTYIFHIYMSYVRISVPTTLTSPPALCLYRVALVRRIDKIYVSFSKET